MIIILKQQINDAQKSAVKDFLKSRGFKVKEIVGQEETVLGAVGTNRIDIREVAVLGGGECNPDLEARTSLPGVEEGRHGLQSAR